MNVVDVPRPEAWPSDRGVAPVRAVQRLSAIRLGARDAGLPAVADGGPAPGIARKAYLETGRMADLVRPPFRGDACEIKAGLRP